MVAALQSTSGGNLAEATIGVEQMMKHRLKIVALASVVLFAAAPANAVAVLTLGPLLTTDPGPSAGQTTALAFTNVLTPATGNGTGNANAVLAGNFAILSTSTSGAAAPAGFSGFFLSVPDPSGATPGTATITFSGALAAATSLSFLWGSVDTYNTFSLTDSTGTTSIAGIGTGDQSTSSRLYATNISGLKSITFSSSQRAFEADTIYLAAGAVPEPATWGLMILGFGAAGATLRRRTIAAGRATA